MNIEEHFDYLGKNANNFSFLDIMNDMRHGLLAIGLFTAFQTIGFAYYIYFFNPKPTKIVVVPAEIPIDIQLEELNIPIKEPNNEDILEQLKKLSVKKRELNELCSKITHLQDDIESIREKLEELHNTPSIT